MLNILDLFKSRQDRFERIADSIFKTKRFQVERRDIILQKERYNWFELDGIAFRFLSFEERDHALKEFQAILGTNNEGIIYIRSEPTVINFQGELIPTIDLRFFVGVPSDSLYAFNARITDNPLKKRPRVKKTHLYKLVLEDNTLAKVFVAYRFPDFLPEGFLYSVFKVASEIFIVWFKEPVSRSLDIIDRAKKRKAGGETTKESKEFENLYELGSRIMAGADLISIYLIFIVKAESEAELKEKSQLLVNELKTYNVEVQDLPVYNRDVYMLEDVVFRFFGLEKKYTDTESAKPFFPFISEYLHDDDGIFLGLSGTGKPVVFNIYTKPNYIMVILGASGSGKSTTAKIYLRRMLEKHRDLLLIGIDPESEYVREDARRLIGVDAVNLKEGQKMGLDPIRLMQMDVEEQILTVGQIVDILSDIYAIPTQLQGLLKNELYLKVEKRGDVDNIIDFVDSISDRRLKQYLAGVTSPPDLYIYEGKPPRITGSVVFGMKDIKSNATKVLISALLSAYVYNRLLTKARKSIFFVDEAWIFSETRSILSLFDNIAKRGRKYGCNFVYITQRVEDIAKTSEGRAILEQASTTMIFRHEKESMDVLRDVFKLNPSELNFIVNASVGSCIFKTAGKKIKLKVKPTKEELSAFSTTPV